MAATTFTTDRFSCNYFRCFFFFRHVPLSLFKFGPLSDVTYAPSHRQTLLIYSDTKWCLKNGVLARLSSLAYSNLAELCRARNSPFRPTRRSKPNFKFTFVSLAFTVSRSIEFTYVAAIRRGARRSGPSTQNGRHTSHVHIHRPRSAQLLSIAK